MKKFVLATAAIQAALLTACGGGGSSDSAAPASATPATPAALTISGTAATGAAISGGLIDVKCAAGTGTATTIADGSYTVTISGGSLPCVMHVTAGSTELYSLAEGGSGNAVRANITPLSQLVAAQVAGADPATLFTNFDASAQTRLTAANVATAIAAVTSALSGAIDLSGIDPLKDPLVAANGGTAGNTLDQKLDALKAALAAAGVTLADVTTTLVASGADTQAPVKTLLQPVTAACAGLRSGNYRSLNPNETDPAWANHVFAFDAATLTAKLFDGETLTLTDAGHCTFTAEGGATRFLVSKSGASIALSTVSATQTEASLVIPEQTIPLSELAGSWNMMSYERDVAGGPLKPSSATLTLDAAGKFSAGADCAGLSACTPWSTLPGNLTANSAGGFQFTDSDGITHRLFAFKTADGQISLYVLHPNNIGFAVAARQQAQALPAVGAVNTFWDFSVGSAGYVSTVTDATMTTQSVDTASSSYTRVRTADGRVDGFTINKPRDGVRYRAAGSSATTSGGTVNYAEILAMQLPGTGLSVNISVNANQNFFGISVNHP
jgi:hypothetical protein